MSVCLLTECAQIDQPHHHHHQHPNNNDDPFVPYRHGRRGRRLCSTRDRVGTILQGGVGPGQTKLICCCCSPEFLRRMCMSFVRIAWSIVPFPTAYRRRTKTPWTNNNTQTDGVTAAAAPALRKEFERRFAHRVDFGGCRR